MGGIDAKTAVSSLLLNIVNICVLFIILRALVYKPVKKFMTSRTEGVETQLKEAEARLAQAEEDKALSAEALAGATEEANTEKRKILEAADVRAQEITAAAEDEAEKIKESALIKASHTAEQMMADMHDKIADLSIEIASRVMEREISKGDNSDIIDKYFNRVG